MLIVEDERAIQFFYQSFLTLYGFEVVGIANNGEEAVNTFKSFLEKPKVILMDYRMPIKNGIEATKEIMKINGKAKVIFLSADNSIKEEALSIGAVSFKSKPFDFKELIYEIKRVLE